MSSKVIQITTCHALCDTLWYELSQGGMIAAGIAVFDAIPVFGTGGIMLLFTLLELLDGNYTE